jgi:membrane protease YdiL (CAAX protease family)
MLGPLGTGEVIGLALLSGFSEELFFRGAVQGAWGWFPATVLFALLHAGPGTTFKVWTAFAGIAGLTMAGLMIWRGNLLAPVVTHVLVNAVNLGRLSRLSDVPTRVPDPAD